MAHVWNVIDGDIYVSKNGDDVTGDGSMAAPYASLNKGFLSLAENQKIVIGTGLWHESISIRPKSFILSGDGDVVFSGSGVAFFKLNYSYEILGLVQIDIENIKMIEYIGSSFISGNLGHPSNIYKFNFYNCILDANAINIYVYSGSLITLNKCLYTNAEYEASNTAIYSSTIIIKQNAASNAYYYAENSIIINAKINYGSPSLTVSCLLLNLNNGGIAGGLFKNCIYFDPKFNNSEIGDYTLKSDSPCLYAGKNNSTIGAFGLGYSYNANSSEFTKQGGAVFSQTATVDDIVKTQQTINGITRFLFQLAAGHLTGNIESAWIDMQQIRYLLITRLYANIIYNVLGVATSRPDNLETAGEKAVYYDFELKYCNEESEKAAATFKKAIWNKAVTIDNSNRGNADSAFVPAEAKYISARFIKIKLYMTEA